MKCVVFRKSANLEDAPCSSCVIVHLCFAGSMVSCHSVACYLSFCSQGELCLSMSTVFVCHACDVAVFGCLGAMYFIPRERCLVESGRVHSTPWIVSLIMLVYFFCRYQNQSMLVLYDTICPFCS